MGKSIFTTVENQAALNSLYIGLSSLFSSMLLTSDFFISLGIIILIVSHDRIININIKIIIFFINLIEYSLLI